MKLPGQDWLRRNSNNRICAAIAVTVACAGMAGCGSQSVGTSAVGMPSGGTTCIAGTPAGNTCNSNMPETFGAKLRRLASAAGPNNPLNKPYLITSPAWQANTAYVVGQVVNSAGRLYICYTPGRSGSAPPASVLNALIPDGTAAWYFDGAPTASTTSAPSVADNTSTPEGLTQLVKLENATGPFAVNGGNLTPASMGYAIYSDRPYAAIPDAYEELDVSVSFVTDAPVVDIMASSSFPYRLLVNGQYVFAGGRLTTNHDVNNNLIGHILVLIGHILVDFSQAGSRALRTITMEMTQDGYFYGVNVDASSQISAPSQSDSVTACIFGDSIVSGHLVPFIAGDTWPQMLSKTLGWSDLRNLAIGGTGYLAEGANGTGYSFGGHIDDVTSNTCQLVMFFGGHNDQGQSSASVTAAALADFQSVRTQKPSAPILVFGVYPGAASDPAPAVATENAIQAAVVAFNDANTYFIPIMGDPDGPWITGTGTVEAPNGTGNSDFYINTDGTHPVEPGIRYIMRRVIDPLQGILGKLP